MEQFTPMVQVFLDFCSCIKNEDRINDSQPSPADGIEEDTFRVLWLADCSFLHTYIED